MAASKHNLNAPLFSGYRLNRRDVSIASAVKYFRHLTDISLRIT